MEILICMEFKFRESDGCRGNWIVARRWRSVFDWKLENIKVEFVGVVLNKLALMGSTWFGKCNLGYARRGRDSIAVAGGSQSTVAGKLRLRRVDLGGKARTSSGQARFEKRRTSNSFFADGYVRSMPF
jgi:hypothetical protein